MNVVLNLKLVRTKITTSDDKVTLKLTKNKQGDIFARDFDTAGKAEIVNPDQYICHLSKDFDFTIEIEVSRGVGYLSVDEIDFVGNLNPADILVDAVFSPVTNVALNVEKVRVGDNTNFESLEIQFTTDNSVDGKEVIDFSLSFIDDLFKKIKSSLGVSEIQFDTDIVEKKVTKIEGEDQDKDSDDTEEDKKEVNTKLKSENLKLTPKIMAILDNNDIKTNSELLARQDEVSDFAGLTSRQKTAISNYIKKITE